MSPFLFYDRQGRPLPNVLAWAKLFEDVEYQVVAQEDVLGSTGEMAWVSTVWLGIPQNLSALEGYGPPIIFETAIFESPRKLISIWARYATERAAQDGHKLAVQAIADGIFTPPGEEEP
jgi:hypothetical protein